jgi:hypothetical protein
MTLGIDHCKAIVKNFGAEAYKRIAGIGAKKRLAHK